MKKINKRTEPKKWKDYRRTPGASYEAKPELRDALLKEQGYICCYCMRRIPIKDPDNREDTRIEHLKCRKKHPHLQLVFKNMVICCPGAINAEVHCDKSKGAANITLDPFSRPLEKSISYSSKDGKIQSTNETWNAELNSVLNLNNPLLMANRKEVINGICSVLKNYDFSTAQIQTKLASWRAWDKDGKFKPYCGVVIWYLKRILQQKP